MPTNTSFVETDYLWVENLDILNLGNLRGRTQVFPNKDASGQEAQMLTISGQLPFYTFLFSAWRAFDFPDLALCARSRCHSCSQRAVPGSILLHVLFTLTDRLVCRPWYQWLSFSDWWIRNAFEVRAHRFPRTPEFSTSVILRGWKAQPAPTGRSEKAGPRKARGLAEQEEPAKPRIEKRRRGVGTLKLLLPHRFQAPVLPMNIYPLDLVWQLSAEPLQTGI